MLHVLLHYMLRDLVVVMLRWVSYLLGLLKFLLTNRGVSWFDHIRRLLFFDWSQLRARLVLWAQVALLPLIVLILLLDLHDLVLRLRGWLLRILRVLRHRVILLVQLVWHRLLLLLIGLLLLLVRYHTGRWHILMSQRVGLSSCIGLRELNELAIWGCSLILVRSFGWYPSLGTLNLTAPDAV